MNRPGFTPLTFEDFTPGERVILDENFDEVKRVKFEAPGVVKKGDPQNFTYRCVYFE